MAPAKIVEVLFHDVHIIAGGIKGADAHLFALGAVVAVIIICTDDGDAVFAQNTSDTG